MKFLETLTNNKRKLVFFDLEGTQTTSEIIAIAAIKVTLDAKYNIKKVDKNGFKRFVIPKGNIGRVIVKLTGITDEIIDKEGIPFNKAMDAFLGYVGKDFNESMFVTYGNYDKKLLFNTSHLNNDYRMDEIKYISKNYIDFAMFLSKFMKDEKHNCYSLTESVEALGGHFNGTKHDPLFDTLNLVQLWDLFTKNRTLVKEEYKKLICSDPKMPKPLQNVIKKLNCGQNVTPKDFETYIDEYLK